MRWPKDRPPTERKLYRFDGVLLGGTSRRERAEQLAEVLSQGQRKGFVEVRP